MSFRKLSVIVKTDSIRRLHLGIEILMYSNLKLRLIIILVAIQAFYWNNFYQNIPYLMKVINQSQQFLVYYFANWVFSNVEILSILWTLYYYHISAVFIVIMQYLCNPLYLSILTHSTIGLKHHLNYQF